MSGRIEDLHRARKYSSNVTRLIVETTDKGGPVIQRVDNRLVTIAITENSNAYNAEHRHAIIDRAQQLGLVEIWDAELDIQTCEHCASLDGSESIDGAFPGGATPGNVHGRCRCTSHFVRRSILH